MIKVIQFFSEVKSELSKVVWPTKQQTLRYTGVVILFSVLVSIVLASADYGLIKGLEKLIER
ncbi:MAG: Protein translocase subunit SecE [Candidatus Doudnabacteria bacterium Gr01-1014_77]|jgi:preprotein translocase subunit SecE|uniref:Protein translocase subunit SecE n=1 Tax=Candidatus Doudnabacteria bacterium Gr01-1014_77 TaxID=2017133 RepID=A0A554JAE7_9BACT|nr:MAG: Protein translocase subunit SecE [Candidatus Doudnabacteria bacterium Gr01-1014_77]